MALDDKTKKDVAKSLRQQAAALEKKAATETDHDKKSALEFQAAGIRLSADKFTPKPKKGVPLKVFLFRSPEGPPSAVVLAQDEEEARELVGENATPEYTVTALGDTSGPFVTNL